MAADNKNVFDPQIDHALNLVLDNRFVANRKHGFRERPAEWFNP
jgi:hypothetical protein